MITAEDRASTRTAPSLSEVLTVLGDRVAPVAMARERTLPVADEYVDLFAEGGLVRGRVLSCVGDAATSLALGLIAPAVATGAWVAVIDVPTFGPDAASELGVPLERVVAISTAGTDESGRRWADVVAAAADGFDLLIVRVPADVRATTVRKVATRLQQRGAVMLVLGEPGVLTCDGVLDTAVQTWSGIGRGWGHLQQREVEVTAAGRRIPGRRRVTVSFPSRVSEPRQPTVEPVSALSAVS